MCFAAVEVDAGGLAGLGQYGLAVGEAGKRRGVEAGEGVEGIALDAGPVHRGIEEAEVEAGVVADQDGAFAAVGFDRLAQAAEDFRQRVFLAHRHAQRVVQLDPGELQRSLFDVGAFERLDAEEVSVVRIEEALFIHGDGGRRDFQQGVGGGVESAGFHVHHDRQVATEARRHRVARAGRQAAVQFVVVKVFAHACSSSRRQRSFSPARSGTTACSPSGRVAGAVHSSRTRVMRSVLRGRP
ncbi:hypothetical protein D9M71_500920 [compost metagenome]